MSLIDLEKKVAIVLEKRSLPAPPPTRVGMVIDGSLSMRNLYRGGVVQRVVDRLLAVAAKFDDDGTMDMWMFDQYSHPLKAAGPADYNDYVEHHILSRFHINGGTELVPVLLDVFRSYALTSASPNSDRASQAPRGFFARMFGVAGREPDQFARAYNQQTPSSPVFIMIITDGENADQSDAYEVLAQSVRSGHKIFWQFVGIGKEKFRFLKQVAQDFPNVEFCSVDDIASVADEDLYERILSEKFVGWLRA